MSKQLSLRSCPARVDTAVGASLAAAAVAVPQVRRHSERGALPHCHGRGVYLLKRFTQY